MKTKKFQKKLTLNKKTIDDLNNGQMKGVQGGVLETSGWCIPKPTVVTNNCTCTCTINVGHTCCPVGGLSC